MYYLRTFNITWPTHSSSTLAPQTSMISHAPPAFTINTTLLGPWNEASAPWSPRSGLGAVSFDDKIWVIGGSGNDPLSTYSDVWSSRDGINWTEVASTTPWAGRKTFGTAVFKNSIWILGGFGGLTRENQGIVVQRNGRTEVLLNQPQTSVTSSLSFLNNFFADVWSSTDGGHWTELTATAPWEPRALASVVVLNGRLYLLGGFSFPARFLNDVWSSTDGVHWREETAAAPWEGRGLFGATVYKDKIWIFGGGDARRLFSGVWNTQDGKNWTRVGDLPSGDSIIAGAVATDGAMWILVNETAASGNALDAEGVAEVWRTTDGISWTLAATSSPWLGENPPAAVLINNRICVLGGEERGNNVWCASIR